MPAFTCPSTASRQDCATAADANIREAIGYRARETPSGVWCGRDAAAGELPVQRVGRPDKDPLGLSRHLACDPAIACLRPGQDRGVQIVQDVIPPVDSPAGQCQRGCLLSTIATWEEASGHDGRRCHEIGSSCCHRPGHAENDGHRPDANHGCYRNSRKHHHCPNSRH